jgi:hypothetical protein
MKLKLKHKAHVILSMMHWSIIFANIPFGIHGPFSLFMCIRVVCCVIVCVLLLLLIENSYFLPWIVNIIIVNPQGVVSIGLKPSGKTTPFRLTILDVYIH